MHTRLFGSIFLFSSIAAILVASFRNWYPIQSIVSPSFIAIIDAGSSGSRLVVYNSTKQTIFQLCRFSIEPGLNSYSGNLEGAWESIHSILKEGEQCIHSLVPEVQKVPLYLFGTGGMRLLGDKDTMPLFRFITDQVQQTESLFSLNIEDCTLLSGEDEAKYGWYSVNYLSNRFDTSLTIGKEELFGSLDLGGESLEIAFYNNLRKRLQSTSYSYLGANQMRKHIGEYIARGLKSTTVVNPCYPKDYSETAFGNTFIGSGNFEECAQLVDSLFHSSAMCRMEGNLACQFVNKGINQQNTTFYGMSLFFYVADFVAFADKGESAENRIFHAEEFHASLKRISEWNWESLDSTLGERHPYTSRNLLPYRMLQGLWMESILKSIEKQGNEKRNHIIFVKNVNQQELDWTLGAAMYIIKEQ